MPDNFYLEFESECWDAEDCRKELFWYTILSRRFIFLKIIYLDSNVFEIYLN